MPLLNLFYNTKEMHKLLIQSSYNDFDKEIDKFNNKYPNFKGYIIGGDDDECNNLDEKTKKDWNEYKEKMNELEIILFNNLFTYCKNYPHEKISNNRFINEYKEYPYRLQQNISRVMLDL